MNTRRGPARLVLPGRIITRELEARGWQQKDLAQIMGRPEQAISEIINGKKQITAETARELANAMGTSMEFWMNLEANYRLNLAKRAEEEELIRRRARLYAATPYREIVARGWIEDKDSLDDQEREVCRFLGVSSLDEDPPVAMAARRSARGEPEVPLLIAWARRVHFLAARQQLATYSRDGMVAAMPSILRCAAAEEDVVRVPETLRALGVSFVIVPNVPYLDGAAMYQDGRPIVALTLRLKWLDSFWFTLLHELGHIVAGHPGTYLDFLDDDERSMTAEEHEADALAQDWLMDREAYAAFASRPRISNAAVAAFAARIGRHPSIVAGRLQHDTGQYGRYTKFRVRVAERLAPWVDSPERMSAEQGAEAAEG